MQPNQHHLNKNISRILFEFDSTCAITYRCNISRVSGVADDKKAEALKFLADGSKMSYEISNSGDDWEFKVGTKAGEKTIKFSLGQEFDTFTLDGRPIKVSKQPQNGVKSR